MANETVADIIKGMRKKLAKEEGIKITTSDDLQLASHVPFAIPSGLPQFELSIGKPGYPAGRIVELFGFEMCGKSTAALHAIAACQRLGGLALYIDTEFTFEAIRAKMCGVDVDNLMIGEADTIEGTFILIEKFLDDLAEKEWNKPSIVVVDSITAVESEGVKAKSLKEESRVGQDARVIRRALRRVTSRITRQKTCALFINHAIANIGVGNPKTSAGGHALKFFASLRLDFTFIKNLVSENDEEVKTRDGQIVKIEIRKNKMNATGCPDFQIVNGINGFDIYDGLLEVFQGIRVVTKPNQKMFHYAPSETTFTRSEWKALVNGLGGPERMYEFFLKKAEELGKITQYGADIDDLIIAVPTGEEE